MQMRRVCAQHESSIFLQPRTGIAVKHNTLRLSPLPGEHRDKDGVGLGQQHVSGRLGRGGTNARTRRTRSKPQTSNEGDGRRRGQHACV